MQRSYKYLLSILLFFIVVNAHANNLDDIKKQANQGDVVAQYMLAVMYHQGKGIKQSKKIALSWYTKSAEQSYLIAQYALIAIYQYGDGTSPSPNKVKYWYEEVSKPRSLTLLATQQRSTEKNIVFLQRLAEKNNINAQYLLANLYANNNKDNLANYWFLRAAMAEDKNAQYYIGLAYQDQPGFFNKMLGIYWLEKSAQQNFLDAAIVLASIYEQNKEIAPNFKRAAYWYEKAAKQGDAKAQSFIAGMYRDGKGVQTDKQKALMWYKMAAKQGDAFSQYNLGRMYEAGDGAPIDIKKAIYWYEQGVKQGHAASELKLKSLQTNTQ